MNVFPGQNPFCSRRISAGAVPFLFPEDGETTPESLLERWKLSGRIGQIVGPHGTGKTTLLETLYPLFREREIAFHVITLRDRQRKLPSDFRDFYSKNAVVVDGYEQLGIFGRLFLRSLRSRFGNGLLLTSHRAVFGVPVLYRTSKDFQTLVRLLDCILQQKGGNSESGWKISKETLKRLYEEHRGNLRLVLLSLYDLYEESFATCLTNNSLFCPDDWTKERLSAKITENR